MGYESEQQVSFQIYPNPAEEHATIQFTLRQSSHVYIKVYDLSGKEIAYPDLLVGETLLDDYFEKGDPACAKASAGRHSLQLNTNHFAEGVYVVKLISPAVLRDGIENQKLIVQ